MFLFLYSMFAFLRTLDPFSVVCERAFVRSVPFHLAFVKRVCKLDVTQILKDNSRLRTRRLRCFEAQSSDDRGAAVFETTHGPVSPALRF